jgi:hypothetical protein
MIRRENAQFEFGVLRTKAGGFGVKNFSGQGAFLLRDGFR